MNDDSTLSDALADLPRLRQIPMSKAFDPIAYVIQAGRELVAAFEAGSFATTPAQVGSAREVPARKKFMQLLPRGVGVGSGFVIDSFGATSRQMDVVLYEREICPVFAINEDPASTYYPCEGVIAVGEIKSVLDSNALIDTFEKIDSVKKLRRFARATPGGPPGVGDYVAYRKYGSLSGIATPKPGDYDQTGNPRDQIYGFSLAGRVALSAETLCDKFLQLALDTGYELSPNLVAALDGTVVCPLSIPTDLHNPSIVNSIQQANSIYSVVHPDRSFSFLLAKLQEAFSFGRTVEAVAFGRYFAKEGVLTLPPDGTTKWLP
ncbi:MAG: hypothetical protein OXM62_06000 [bacterium]|nr:hypothetical protein [bacterium]MDE0234541.1 hypothetical protein [bacterium]